jgi:hypothetical protein
VASCWDVACRIVEDPVVGPSESALLDGNIINDMQAVDLDVRVGEATNQLPSIGRPTFLTAHPARRSEHDVVRQHLGEPVEIMGIERLSPPFSRAYLRSPPSRPLQ